MAIRKPLMAALEDASLDAGTDVDDAGVEVSNDLLEAAETEISNNDEAVAIESLALSIEDAVEGAEEMESMVETVEEASGVDAETGEQVEGATADGLNEEAAVVAQEAFAMLHRRLGLQTGQVMPSMESFRSGSSRRVATRIALESAMDKVKEIWERIWAAIKALWAKVVAFYKKLTDANTKLEKAAKALQDRIKKLKTKVSKDADFESSGLRNAFPTKGDLGSREIINYIDNHLKMNGDATPLIQKLASMATPQTLSDKFITSANALMQTLIVYSTGKSANIENKEDEQEASSDHLLVDGKIIKAKYVFNIKSGNDDEAKDDKGTFKFAYSFDDAENADKGEGKVKVGVVSELNAVLTAVLNLAKHNKELIKNGEKAAKEFDSATKKVIDGINKKAGNSEEDGIELRDNARYFRFMQAAMTTTSSKVAGFTTDLGARNARAGRVALNYVSQCLSKY